MNPCRIAHALADLAVDAIEAVIHAPHFNRAADDLWARAADRLADEEAEYEVAEPAKELTTAAAYQAIDILIAENGRLRADLATVRNQRDEANARATWKGMAP